MLSLSDYGADAWSGLLVGVGSLPGSFYVALIIGQNDPDVSVDGTTLGLYEPTDGAYARQTLGTGSSNWNGPSGGVMTSKVTITFPTALITWGKVRGIALCDASTAGNVWATGPADTISYVDVGDIYILDAGTIALGLSRPNDGTG